MNYLNILVIIQDIMIYVIQMKKMGQIWHYMIEGMIIIKKELYVKLIAIWKIIISQQKKLFVIVK